METDEATDKPEIKTAPADDSASARVYVFSFIVTSSTGGQDGHPYVFPSFSPYILSQADRMAAPTVLTQPSARGRGGAQGTRSRRRDGHPRIAR